MIHTKLRGRIQNSKPVARLRIAKASRIVWDAHGAALAAGEVRIDSTGHGFRRLVPQTGSADWDSTMRASLHFAAQSPLSESDMGIDTCDASEAIEFAAGKGGKGFAWRSTAAHEGIEEL